MRIHKTFIPWGPLLMLTLGAWLGSEPQPADAATIYFNNFEGAVGAEWSNTSTDVTPVGARRFLGQFGAEAVSLSLGGLPAHSEVALELDLFTILTWDGTGEVLGFGPDIWTLSVGGGPTLLHTTFALHPQQVQNYPDAFPGPTHPLATGATEHNTLGYVYQLLEDPEDAVYHLSFTFPHSDSSLVLNFAGIGLQPIADESWGLDNVRVSIEQQVPEPGAIWLLATGMLAAYRRRKRI